MNIEGDGEVDGEDGADVVTDDVSGDADAADADAEGDEGPAAGCVRFVDIDSSAASPDGTTWATAFTSVQEAIDDAALAASAEEPCEVWIAAGTYYVFRLSAEDTIMLRPFVAVRGGFEGTEDSAEGRDWAAHPTVLDGRLGPAETIRVYHVLTGSDDALLEGVTITHGAANASTGTSDTMSGGGMINVSCSPTIASCIFEENEAVATSLNGGGAMSNLYSSSPRIVDCIFRNNTASGPGGAILGHQTSAIDVSGTLFEGNSADNGGAIWSGVDSPVTIDGCVFRGNHAGMDGGAMSLGNMTSTVGNSVFTGNGCEHMGGAIKLSAGTLQMTSCSFHGNSTEWFGGGAVHLSGTAGLVAVNTIFFGDVPNEIEMVEATTADFSYCVISPMTSGAGNLDVDPLYADAGAGDMALSPSSPCIDAGDGDHASGLDAAGNPRVDDPGVANTGAGDPPYADIGAFEHVD